MHYCDIFRATRSSFISCYTYFGEIFCQTHFLRHLFSHLFCETSAYWRRPIFEFRTTRKQTHSPSSFLQAYCRECVAVQCIFKKSALRAHTVAIEAKKHNTRFKQERLCVSLSFSCLVLVLFIFSTHMREQLKTRFKPCNNLQTSQVLCFTFLFGSGSVDVLCSHASSIWQDSSHPYNNLDYIIIARLGLSCAF